MKNSHKLKQMELQNTLSAQEDSERQSAPDCRAGLDAILPSPDDPVALRLLNLAEAVFFCNRLRDALDERLQEEAELLEGALDELAAKPPKSEEGGKALEVIGIGVEEMYTAVRELAEYLENDDQDLFEESVACIHSSHETLREAEAELESLSLTESES